MNQGIIFKAKSETGQIKKMKLKETILFLENNLFDLDLFPKYVSKLI